MEKETNLVIVIVNQGFATEAMEAAKQAGAQGGTIIHGRGTGKKRVEQEYGIAITPEKELLLILTLKENADNVMDAIYKAVGIDKAGHGIVFSLPAEKIVGLKYDKL